MKLDEIQVHRWHGLRSISDWCRPRRLHELDAPLEARHAVAKLNACETAEKCESRGDDDNIRKPPKVAIAARCGNSIAEGPHIDLFIEKALLALIIHGIFGGRYWRATGRCSR